MKNLLHLIIRRFNRPIAAALILGAALVPPALAAPPTVPAADSVRKALVMLPYFSVFDNLEYRVDGDTVTLLGQVRRPTLARDAEAVVKRVPGISRVNNHIEVLPLSNFDDRIRLEAYRRIYGTAPLDRYALQAVPPIHIIVKNGNITLTGLVATKLERDLAGIRANQTSGSFTVTNNLLVEREMK